MAEKMPEWLKYNEDGSVDIYLSRAATVAGVKTSTMRMREPLVGDQELVAEMTGSDASREIRSFSHLCAVTPDEIRQLPMRDYKRLQKAFAGFLD